MAKKYSVELHAPAEFKKKSINSVTVYGLPTWTSKLTRIKTFFILLERIGKSNADVFHFHDPELIILGLIIKILRRRKVIYDVHENTVQLINDRSWISKIIKKPLAALVYTLEKFASFYFDKIIIAEKSYKSFLPRNSEIIYNFPIAFSSEKELEKKYDAIYIGGVMAERGAFELLKIAGLVKKSLPSFSMKIIGPIGAKIEKDIHKYISDHQLESCVTMTGRVDYGLAMEQIKLAKIGLALLHPLRNYVNSLPTKVFEYMNYGLPYIASDFGYWKEFFGGGTAGYFIPYDDVDQAANMIVMLLNDDLQREKLGKQGKELFAKKYGWATEEKKLFSVYGSILNKNTIS